MPGRVTDSGVYVEVAGAWHLLPPTFTPLGQAVAALCEEIGRGDIEPC